MTERRRVTAKDVAVRAGVSQSTVSYVINDTPNQSIPEATRQRVLDAVRHLGYRPSAAARALRSGASRTVLIVLPDAPIGPSIAQLVELVSDALDPHGYTVVYRRHRGGQDLGGLWHELMPAAIVNLIVLPGEAEAEIAAAGIPVVGVHIDDTVPGVINSPQVRIGLLQVEHLRERGHRRIGYAAPPDHRVDVFYIARLAGVREGCARLGLPEPVVLPVPPDVAAAAAAARAWVEAADPVTAVCAYNDDVAFALLAGMRSAGLAAPDDLAVIGVDNQPLSPFASPPLTSVDIHVDRSAAELAEQVLAQLVRGHVARADTGAAVTLVLRQTT
ncbi:LacI family DNA-binding transcriptional regulator [Cellulomonas hominis]